MMQQERKKEIPYKKACEGHRVRSGYAVLWGQGYEGVVSGKCFATSRDLHFYVMAVPSGARVVRAL
jgi:hypothetical protein